MQFIQRHRTSDKVGVWRWKMLLCLRGVLKSMAQQKRPLETTSTCATSAPRPSPSTLDTTELSDNGKTSGPEPCAEPCSHSSPKLSRSASCNSSLIHRS